MEFIVGMEFIIKIFEGKLWKFENNKLDKYWEKIFELFRGQFIKIYYSKKG